jgi:hypothetical protein
MSRLLLTIALLCCWGAGLAAQTPAPQTKVARVQLVGGEVIEGEVRRMDENGIVLVVDGEERVLGNDAIDRLLALGLRGERLVGLPARRDPPPAPSATTRRPLFAPAPGGEVAPAESTESPPSDELEGADPGAVDDADSSPDVAPARVVRPTTTIADPDTTPDSLLAGLIQRYAWFIPDTPGYKASAGAAFLIVLAMLIQVSAKMCQIEHASFGRAMLLAVGVAVVLTIQTLLPIQGPLLVIAMLVADTALWFTAIRAVFGSRFLDSLIMLICFTLLGLVGLVVLSTFGLVLQTTAGV